MSGCIGFTFNTYLDFYCWVDNNKEEVCLLWTQTSQTRSKGSLDVSRGRQDATGTDGMNLDLRFLAWRRAKGKEEACLPLCVCARALGTSGVFAAGCWCLRRVRGRWRRKPLPTLCYSLDTIHQLWQEASGSGSCMRGSVLLAPPRAGAGATSSSGDAVVLGIRNQHAKTFEKQREKKWGINEEG